MQGRTESILDQEQVYERPEEMGNGGKKPKLKPTADPPPPLPDGPPK